MIVFILHILSATVIDHLKRSTHPSTTAVLFFFCGTNNPTAKDLHLFLSTLVRQLLDQSQGCIAQARDRYSQKNKDTTYTLNTREYISLIQHCFGNFEQVFLIVDALDELHEKGSILEILKCILTSWQFANAQLRIPSTKIMLTSRLDRHVQRVLHPLVSFQLSLEDNSHCDVQRFISEEITSRMISRKLKFRDNALQGDIQNTITNRAGT